LTEVSEVQIGKEQLDKAEREIDTICTTIRTLRKKPLLVMYYPDGTGTMSDEDMAALYDEFRRRGFNRDTQKIENLDVLLHTLGGKADTGYMLAQIIRSFGKNVEFLIPYHAASAGTLASFSANRILLGAYAYLTPIDVSLGEFSLMAIDYFMDFAVESRRKMEMAFRSNQIENADSSVESDLLVEMLKQMGAMNVGKFYRTRTLTAYYARLLLSTYMFNGNPEANELAENISTTTVFNFPTHEFFMDYHMCKNLGLTVEEMSEEASDITKELVKVLDKHTMDGIICKEIEKDYRAPFVRLYS
jgi:hypothetical protein